MFYRQEPKLPYDSQNFNFRKWENQLHHLIEHVKTKKKMYYINMSRRCQSNCFRNRINRTQSNAIDRLKFDCRTQSNLNRISKFWVIFDWFDCRSTRFDCHSTVFDCCSTTFDCCRPRSFPFPLRDWDRRDQLLYSY